LTQPGSIYFYYPFFVFILVNLYIFTSVIIITTILDLNSYKLKSYRHE